MGRNCINFANCFLSFEKDSVLNILKFNFEIQNLILFWAKNFNNVTAMASFENNLILIFKRSFPGVLGLNRYIEQQQSTLSWKAAKKEKKKRKEKKMKDFKTISSSSEENITTVHQVNRADGEMPENAKSTDDDEEIENLRDADDDAYKALDMDLEENLKESPPTVQTRPNMLNMRQSSNFSKNDPAACSSCNGTAFDEQRISKIIKKRKEKHNKDDGKYRKKTKGKREASQKSTKNQFSPVRSSQSWVDSSKIASSIEKDHSSDPSDRRISKSRRLETRMKESKNIQELTEIVEPIDKEIYEITSGVCTPSNPNFGSFSNGAISSGDVTPQRSVDNSWSKLRLNLSSYKLLGESKDLKMMYETQVSTEDANQVAVCVVFTNVNGNTIRQLEINILDTLNTRLITEERQSPTVFF